MVPELSYRVSTMMAVFKPSRSKLFSNARIPLKARWQLADSYLFSRSMYNAGTWPTLRPPEFHIVHTARMRVLRAVAKRYNVDTDVHFSDRDVLNELQAPDTSRLLDFRRLVFYQRFLRWAPKPIVAQVQAASAFPNSWGASVERSLQWLWETAPQLEHLPSPSPSCAEWTEFVRSAGKAWPMIVHKALCRSVLLRPTGPPSPPPELAAEWACPLCPASFATRNALFSHSARKHGYRHEAWFFLRGTTCFVCLTQFWSEERLFHHWSARCTACFARVKLGASPLGREELAALLAVVRNRRAAGRVVGRDRKGLRPAIRLPGPVVQPE